MNVIDAHAHIYEQLSGFGPRGEAYAIGGGMVEWANGEREQLLRPEHGDKGFLPETLIALMDEAQVERAVLLQSHNYGLQNRFVAEAVTRFPDRLIGAGAFDPYCAHADAIFANLTENLGFTHLKFDLSQDFGIAGYHPDFSINSARFDRYFSLCEERGITVTTDTGTWGASSYRPDEMAQMLARHPRLTFVVAHTFFPSNVDDHNNKRLESIKRLAHDNVFFDTASLHPTENGEHFAYLRTVMDIVGADHMMWGSDCPGVFRTWNYADLIRSVCKCGYFSEKELASLMHDTAARVYGS
ncbi:MAG: amidohydrolase [Clostridia bacterium]|nr:amidohydrolase [Clostridia bacterium]